jgi:phosphate starvation-inducible PhoH-like protein
MSNEKEETRQLEFSADASNAELANLTGPLDANLRQIETILDVSIARRGNVFRVSGSTSHVRRAIHALQRLLNRIRTTGEELSAKDLQLFFVDERTETEGVPQDDSLAPLKTRRRDLRGRTPRQRDYIKAIQDCDIAFGIGPAGTGKTYLAVASAVDAYERNTVERIILTRPAVEAGERLGFLPGDLSQKVDPYLRPLYDALFDLLGFEKTRTLMERQTIEIAPLAYMRGRTLNNAFIILDEAQNTTPEQMKMFLTRIGFGSKAVITGDITQIDLPHGTHSGLIQAQHVLAGVRGIAFTYFTAADVVRHPLVARIVEAYEKDAESREKGRHGIE